MRLNHKRILSFWIACLVVGSLIIFSSCQEDRTDDSVLPSFSALPSIDGKAKFLSTPYVTAGDRLYAVGYQNGTFPDLGWHVKGEMGGIWNHPIKLMDGFQFALLDEKGDAKVCLNKATQFTNYPIGNVFTYKLPEESVEITRLQFVPDGLAALCVEVTINNFSDKAKTLTLGFNGMIDLMPVWLSERLDIVDGKDKVAWDKDLGAYVANDTNNTWFVVFGNNYESTQLDSFTSCTASRLGNGVDAAMATNLEVAANESQTIRYVISGSENSKAEAAKVYNQTMTSGSELATQKLRRYKEIRATAAIDVPDASVQEMYTWLKWNTDWLMRDVPSVGRGYSAGIPDFPWWFGADNCYTLQALLATGQHEQVKETLQLILKLSKKNIDNGQIMHEASSNGIVFNEGNLNETPHFIWLIWEYYRWTADRTFLEQVYPDVLKSLAWIIEQDHDNNLYPDGPGMMEIHGLHSEMIDVVAYTQAAFDAGAQIAREMDDESNQKKYAALSVQLAQKINSDWWVAAMGSYADFQATKLQSIQLIQDAIIRADTLGKPWAVEELTNKLKQVRKSRDGGTKSFVVHHNWVVNTPMEMKIANENQALMALNTAKTYVNKYGVYVTGIDRNESGASGDENSTNWQDFSYVGAVMSLPTGVQAVAEANYGRSDESLEYIHMLQNSFGYALPGSMYEVAPDYGQLVQAWNIYGVAIPIVKHFFGIQPDAHRKEIALRPQLPSEWKEASIKDVRISNVSLDLELKTVNDELIIRCKLLSKDAGWQFKIFKPAGISKVTFNERNLDFKGKPFLNITI